jgi:hypothetical protein
MIGLFQGLTLLAKKSRPPKEALPEFDPLSALNSQQNIFYYAEMTKNF